MAPTQQREQNRSVSGPQQQGQTGMTTQPKQAMIYEPRLPYHPMIQERFNIDKSSWKALVDAIFPTATETDSIVLALAYCRARGLDIFKRVIHIVPIYNKQLGRMVDTVWPGIGELRTTAHRTGLYAGCDETVFGPMIEDRVGNTLMRYPEWAQVTVYKLMAGTRIPFVGPKVHWLETYATASRNDESPNEMWRNRPQGQLEKCAEAAALRKAFPEELGGDMIPEEVERGATMGTIQPNRVSDAGIGQSRGAGLVERLKQQQQQQQPVQQEYVEAPREEYVPPNREIAEDAPFVPETSEQSQQRQQQQSTSGELDQPTLLTRLKARIEVAMSAESLEQVEMDFGQVHSQDDIQNLAALVKKRAGEIEAMAVKKAPKGSGKALPGTE